MQRLWKIYLIGVLIALACTQAAQARQLAVPGLQSPAYGASVQSLPAFTWSGVRGAAQYEFEFSADTRFSSGVNGFGQGAIRLNNTAITDDKSVPDGTYYWRVRAVTATDHPGAWSRLRVLHKAWTSAPVLNSPLGSGVSWPTNPLVLRWSPVPHAVRYYVWIATDPSLSNLVLGSVSSPQDTYGTVFTFPTALPPGTYYWAITPVDAGNDPGPRSSVSSFVWTWPSQTATRFANVAQSAPGLIDPQFSWDPVPGAAGYQVEVNSSQDFPNGSRFCCDDRVIGTSLSPTRFLPNETTFYWRMRAIDVRGDAGGWNYGPAFTQAFDSLNPTISGLTLNSVDQNGGLNQLTAPGQGTTVAPQTATPEVSWTPIPGASSYEVQLTPYVSGFGCNWTANVRDETTSTSYWTPLGNGPSSNPNPGVWPSPNAGDISTNSSSPWCFRVLAREDDGAVNGGKIVSDWTYLGGFNNPAFTYLPGTAPTGTLQPTQASDYVVPASGSSSPRPPLFTWKPVQGANGYYVAVSRNQSFTDVIDVGYTTTNTYAARVPYPDDTAPYWWEVVPALNGATNSDVENGQDSPQTFTKSSVPPAPLSPINGATVDTVPSFLWSTAEGAKNYRLQIAADPTFATPLEDVTTDSTAYTSENALPADKTLYWRVRANDASNEGLKWSSTSAFTHHLPVPSPLPGNPTGGHSIPVLSWTPVNGAISYDMHVDQADGSTRDFTVESPLVAPVQWYGTGIWRWEVRANFGGNVSGAYSSPEVPYVRVIPAPGGVNASKAGARIIISWGADPDAKQYRVELSTTDGFGSTVASDTTDNTVWAPQIDSKTAARTLFWRLAAVDSGGNVGAYDTGVFHAPRRPPNHRRCIRRKHHRCPAVHRKKK